MGLKEVALLKELEENDPENKYNCIRLLDHFEDRDHLCLVFEPMTGGNLREVLKKYGTKIGNFCFLEIFFLPPIFFFMSKFFYHHQKHFFLY